jgi:catechol 2,3-dioxygenase-like lactoylglutathione lyase family enzyme
MVKHSMLGAAIALVALAVGWSARSQTADTTGEPKLVNTCVITTNVQRLIDFYEPILQQKAKRPSPDYAEFPTSVGVLAIFSEQAQDNYIPGSAKAAENHGLVLEFQVSRVDAEYRRLQTLVKVWVKPPTTQPWGTRSIYFRDPDGNLVDFFTPPSK